MKNKQNLHTHTAYAAGENTQHSLQKQDSKPNGY